MESHIWLDFCWGRKRNRSSRRMWNVKQASRLTFIKKSFPSVDGLAGFHCFSRPVFPFEGENTPPMWLTCRCVISRRQQQHQTRLSLQASTVIAAAAVSPPRPHRQPACTSLMINGPCQSSGVICRTSPPAKRLISGTIMWLIESGDKYCDEVRLKDCIWHLFCLFPCWCLLIEMMVRRGARHELRTLFIGTHGPQLLSPRVLNALHRCVCGRGYDLTWLDLFYRLSGVGS